MSVATRAKKYNIESLQKIAKLLPSTIKRVQNTYNELKLIVERGEKIDEDFKWYLSDHYCGLMLNPVVMSDEEYRDEFQEHLKHLEAFHEEVHRRLNYLRTKEKTGKNISYKQDELNFKKEVVIKVNDAIFRGEKRVVVRSYDEIPEEALYWAQTLSGVGTTHWGYNPKDEDDINYKTMVIHMKR